MMRYPLARKYRPTKLADLVGQDHLVQTLRYALENDCLPQAILFNGTRGVGKTTTARILARTLNCTGAKPNLLQACGTCVSCQALDQDNHLDVVEIDAASRTSVDDMREIIDSAKYKPLQGRFKIFIIDEVHMLSKSAFNALLKTLEEPPAHVLFLFATTEVNKIPDTILSRCMRFDLARIETETLTPHLLNILKIEGIQAEPDAVALIARAGDGSARDAMSILDQAMNYCAGNITQAQVQKMLGLADRAYILHMLQAIFKGDVAQTLALTREGLSRLIDPLLLMQDLLDATYWLTCLKVSPATTDNLLWNKDLLAQANTLIAQLDMPRLMRLWQAMLTGFDEMKMAPDAGQCLQMLVIRLGHLAQMPDITTLLQLAPAASTSAPVAPPQPTIAAPPTPPALVPEPAPPPVQASTLTFPEFLDQITNDNEPVLAAQLRYSVGLVRFEPGAIELNVMAPLAPETLKRNLSAYLTRTGRADWRIVLSAQEAKTLQEMDNDKVTADMEALKADPFVQQVLEAFPGSQLEKRQ